MFLNAMKTKKNRLQVDTKYDTRNEVSHSLIFLYRGGLFEDPKGECRLGDAGGEECRNGY
jgi:hypothetical protein